MPQYNVFRAVSHSTCPLRRVSEAALVTSELNSDAASVPELWPIHQLFGPRWNPEWDTICNSPAISVWTTHLKQILWYTDTDGATQLTVLLITAWWAPSYHALSRKHRPSTDIFKAQNDKELLYPQMKILSTAHFSRQTDTAWQQPEVELSSTSWSDPQKTLTTCHLLSKPLLTRLSTLLISRDEWCAVKGHSSQPLQTVNKCLSQFRCMSKNSL